ncbi:MAG: histidine kinase [Pseudomonadota bacterium]|nr:histidine kinase [Pseudomonadota bacterium]
MPGAAQAPTNPLETLWRGAAIIRVILAAEGLALVLALAPGIEGNRWIQFGLLSLQLQWIALLTLGTLYALRRHLARLSTFQLAWVSTFSMAVITLLLGLLLWLILPEVRAQPAHGVMMQWLRMAGLLSVVGIFAAIVVQNHWQAQQLALQAKQSQLDALRARVNPHFLFNTLNTAAALIHERPDEAERVLLDLADLFRAALSRTDQHTLAEEIELTRRYLEIEQLRLGDRLRVVWALPEPMPVNARLPALALQTLAENAVRHGVEQRPAGGEIRIALDHEPRGFRLRVSNPLPPELRDSATGHKIGIEATQARLDDLAEGRARLLTYIEKDNYVVEIVLPR